MQIIVSARSSRQSRSTRVRPIVYLPLALFSVSIAGGLAVLAAEAGAEIREVKVPAFGRTDVLVKVKVASICGTDLHIYEWDRWAQNRIHPPLIPGHGCPPGAGGCLTSPHTHIVACRSCRSHR